MLKEEPIWKTKGFKSEYDYLTHLAKEEGYKSLEHKYTEFLAKQKGFESEAERRKSAIEKSGFSSFAEYQDHLAQKKGFKSYVKYQEHRVKKRGFKSLYDYYEWLARRAGYESYSDYYTQMRLERNARQKGFESHQAYQEHLNKIEKSIRLTREDISKKKVCEFLQEKIAENVDPRSLFAKGNIDFLIKITECPQLKLPQKISLKKKKKGK